MSIAINFTQNEIELQLQPEIRDARIFSLDENNFEEWYQHKEPWLFDPMTNPDKTILRKISLTPFSLSFIYH
ncbi:MAG: hypothetical protein ACP5E3_11505 [Bacteroidales bacterium]